VSTPQARIVLAALDSTPAARPVLETAARVAELTAAQVEAVHVEDGEAQPLEILTQRAGVMLRRLAGRVESALLGAIAAPEVVTAVIGARATPGGRRPAGRTAQLILSQTGKPTVVVPPDCLAPGPIYRVLLPLEGDTISSSPIIDALLPLLVADVELVVLHVFTEATLPRMLDRPYRDLELLGTEFLATHCPPASRIELRTGPVAARVAEVSKEHSVDLVVLCWSQESSAGHAQVVRDVVADSPVPVLLMPLRCPGCEVV
jgi:nucleotide-binding universal stress UspA family protein